MNLKLCLHLKKKKKKYKEIRVYFPCEKIKKIKKNIGTMGHVGPWARPRKPLLRAAKILN